MLKNSKTLSPLLSVLAAARRPLAVQEIIAAAEKRGLDVHKTTMYRRLSQLMETGEVSEIVFADGIRRYERAEKEHHHHAVCESCGKVEDVILPDDHQKLATIVARVTGFSDLRHVLEFYGLCAKCK